MKKILVVGSESYIGTELSKYLDKKEYNIDCIDIGLNKNCLLSKADKGIVSKKIDLRDVKISYLKNFNVVIFLAGLSLFLNNNIKSLKERNAYKITEEYTKDFILKCKHLNINFIFPSSCSVYGDAASKKFLNEKSRVNPITYYSKNKMIIENFLKQNATKNFKVIIFRVSTVFGWSSRMRFDIVANMFVGMALATREIVLNSDGQAYRPFVEVKDVCKAFESAIHKINNIHKIEIYNIGTNKNNIKIIDLAKLISKLIPKTKIIYLNDSKKIDSKFIKDNQVVKKGKDKRNYKVNFNKASQELIFFNKNIHLEMGLKKMIRELKKRRFSLKNFNDIKFHRLLTLNNLIEKGKVDKNLRVIKTQHAKS